MLDVPEAMRCVPSYATLLVPEVINRVLSVCRRLRRVVSALGFEMSIVAVFSLQSATDEARMHTPAHTNAYILLTYGSDGKPSAAIFIYLILCAQYMGGEPLTCVGMRILK